MRPGYIITAHDRFEVAQFARFLADDSTDASVPVDPSWRPYISGEGPPPPMRPGEPIRRGGMHEIRTWER